MRKYFEHIKGFDRNIINTIVLSFTFNFAISIFNIIYNLYLLKTNFNEETIGNIISGSSFGMIVFSIITIFLSSKLGYKKHLTLFLILSVIANFARIFILNPSYLYWLNFISAGAISAISIIIYPLIIGTAKSKSVTYAFGLNFFSTWIALTIGNLVGGYLPNLLSFLSFSTLNTYKLTLVIGALLTLLSLIPISNLSIGEEHKSQYLNVEKILKALKDKKDLKMMSRYFTIVFIIGLASGLFVPFFNVILKNKFNMATYEIGIIMAISQGLTAFGGTLGPLMAEKIGRVKTVFLPNLSSLPFLIIMGFANGKELFLTAFLIRNILMNMGEPVSSSFILSNIKNDKKIILNSFVNVFFQLGWFIQAPIAGKLMVNFGYSLVFFIATVIYLIRAMFYYGFFKNSDIAIINS